jgi:hypothetical protein
MVPDLKQQRLHIYYYGTPPDSRTMRKRERCRFAKAIVRLQTSTRAAILTVFLFMRTSQSFGFCANELYTYGFARRMLRPNKYAALLAMSMSNPYLHCTSLPYSLTYNVTLYPFATIGSLCKMCYRLTHNAHRPFLFRNSVQRQRIRQLLLAKQPSTICQGYTTSD